MQIEGQEMQDIDIEALFNDPSLDTDTDTETDDNNDSTINSASSDENVMTKAVSKRINEVRQKTESDTKDAIAKELGYDSYSDMKKKREQKIIEEAGFNSEETNKLLNKLIEERLANDPRIKKLEDFERKEKDLFVSNQLKEISALTGQNITDLKQLPDDVLKLWEKTGNLKQSYLAIQGEELLKNATKNRNSSVSELRHLANPSNTSNRNVRPLTDSEKEFYRSIIGDISDDELNAKVINKE